MQTKSALKALGHCKTPDYGMTPYPDESMFDGIKSYQRANKLRVDGIMKPGGETEESMNSRLAAGTRGNGGGSKYPDSNMPVIIPPHVDRNMPILKEPFPPKLDPKDDIYTDPYVDEFGNPILDGKNPKNGKPVRPHTRI